MQKVAAITFTLLLAQQSFGVDVSSDSSDDSASLFVYNGQQYKCKSYPGDPSYPPLGEWAQLNATVNGNLLAALPPTAPCYKSVDGIPTYDAAGCADVQANFTKEQWTCVHFPISHQLLTYAS